ncbi:MAG: glycosyltransferase [Candidatus Competibacteraceae bacterium]|nr:glycosyltransferase [Candidatus Competibacteraceae bacterium]MBK8750477.1 glycosyltransferase [Candidatus Competibacteraceae bacterium]
MRVYLLSTAVAPLGSGMGGGVEHMVVTAACQLQKLGHRVSIIAPMGSVSGLPDLITLPGRLAPTAVTYGRDLPLPIEADAFLITALRWLTARVQSDDVILNFSYDWLPLFLGDYLPCPLATLISMGPLNRSMDLEIHRCAARHPEHVAFLSAAQAASFDMSNPIRLIAPGLELAQYPYNAHPGHAVGWLGRIAPEKGLEDIFALSARTGITVMVFGVMQQPSYWDRLMKGYPNATVRYGGFLTMPALAAAVRDFRALLMTPKWLEAFGIVGIEALACGTPVIAYQRGGVSEYVRDGETGWLVQPDDLEGLCAAAEQIDTIDRARCRALVENHYTVAHYGAALADWLQALTTGTIG